MRRTRELLLELSHTQNIAFVYSSVLISEMAPLGAMHSGHATSRAKILEALCKRNTFISLDRIIEEEFGAIGISPPNRSKLFSANGDWFPKIENIVSPVYIAKTFRDEFKNNIPKNMNRHQRRTANRMAFRGDGLRKSAGDHLLKSIDPKAIAEITATYPMRQNDYEILYKFMLGRGSQQDAENAFLESLRDPSWMMQWFELHSEKLSPVSEWCRKPANDMLGSMHDFINNCQQMLKREQQLGISKSESVINYQKWNSLQDAMLASVGNKVMSKFSIHPLIQPTASDFDEYCPGFSVACRSIHSSAWDSINKTPRTPKSNDFIDAIHAMHAPYVDIFRADRYMATHISKFASRYGTKVVPSLLDLPSAISSALDSRPHTSA